MHEKLLGLHASVSQGSPVAAAREPARHLIQRAGDNRSIEPAIVAWHQFSMFQSVGVHRPRAGRASISSRQDNMRSNHLLKFDCPCRRAIVRHELARILKRCLEGISLMTTGTVLRATRYGILALLGASVSPNRVPECARATITFCSIAISVNASSFWRN